MLQLVLWVCECAGGGLEVWLGWGWGLDAPAHLSATILWPRVTCFCSILVWFFIWGILRLKISLYKQITANKILGACFGSFHIISYCLNLHLRDTKVKNVYTNNLQQTKHWGMFLFESSFGDTEVRNIHTNNLRQSKHWGMLLFLFFFFLSILIVWIFTWGIPGLNIFIWTIYGKRNIVAWRTKKKGRKNIYAYLVTVIAAIPVPFLICNCFFSHLFYCSLFVCLFFSNHLQLIYSL